MEGTVTISLKEYQDLCKHKEACLKRTPIVHSAGFTGWHIYIPTNNNLIDLFLEKIRSIEKEKSGLIEELNIKNYPKKKSWF
jgi:hypothetical protein